MPRRTLRLGSGLAALALFTASVSAGADEFEQARGWLERLAQAMDSLTYQGTFVYLQGGEVETLRLTHVRNGDEARERIVALSGPHREIVRDKTGVRCVTGDGQALAGSPLVAGVGLPSLPVTALEEARARYRFKVGKPARIAGHTGRRISIFPQDRYRYGYDLWLEESTGLLLRWVVYDGERRALAKLMFTELRIGEEVDVGEVESSTPDSRFETIASAVPGAFPVAESAPDAPATLPDDGIPPGFRLAGHSREGEAGQLEHLVLSDGFATVSVYIEPADTAQALDPGLSRMGPTNAWSRSGRRHHVTAIGEVPPVTVRQIAHAFQAQGR